MYIFQCCRSAKFVYQDVSGLETYDFIFSKKENENERTDIICDKMSIKNKGMSCMRKGV